MIKRLFIFGFLILILAAALTGYGLFRRRQDARLKRQNAKAPEEQITIIEGWTVKDIASYLEKKNLVKSADFIEAAKNFNAEDYPLLASKPKTQNLEGFLFPDTYRISIATSSGLPAISSRIIQKQLENFENKFTPEMQAEAARQNLTLYQAVILASIVEKETGRNAQTAAEKQDLQQERQTIAGIFYNRLKAGMPLQSDATVNYITGKNSPQASLDDTKIDSPYNTYLYKGLPPGPICNPSLSSLKAALEPIASSYYYFLHRPDTGQAIYSQTFEQHLQSKQKYLDNK